MTLASQKKTAKTIHSNFIMALGYLKGAAKTAFDCKLPSWITKQITAEVVGDNSNWSVFDGILTLETTLEVPEEHLNDISCLGQFIDGTYYIEAELKYHFAEPHDDLIITGDVGDVEQNFLVEKDIEDLTNGAV